MIPIGASPSHPVRVSKNGRYFVDANDAAVFWLGTTQWELFRQYSLEDVRTILEKSRSCGFVFAQVMLMGVGDGTKPNLHGAKPWIDDNPLTPNEPYFANVDAVMEIAREAGVAISMTIYHQRYRQYITEQNARTWAKWLADRYGRFPNLVWSMTPEAKPEFTPVLRELAEGLHMGDGGAHLITFKPDPSPYTSSFLHSEPWLDFNSMQTWADVQLIYPMVTADYNLSPVKPVLMAEGAYEAGSEYGFDVSPLRVRRQAYYSYLAGAHHTYGHNDSWRVLPTWKQALDAPGAAQLGILKSIFEARAEWWRLTPDQSLLISGGRTDGKLLTLAARHDGGKWMMVYLGSPGSFTLDMSKLRERSAARALWVDPRSGVSTPAHLDSESGTQSFSPPGGWEDALLVVERAA